MTLLVLSLLTACREAPVAELPPALTMVLDVSGSRRACGGALCDDNALPSAWDAYTDVVGVRAGMGLTVWLVGGSAEPLLQVLAPEHWLSGAGVAAKKKGEFRASTRRKLAEINLPNDGQSTILGTIKIAARGLRDTGAESRTLVVVSDLLDCQASGCGWFLEAQDAGQALVAHSRESGGLPPLEGANVLTCGVIGSFKSARVPSDAYFERTAPAFEAFFLASGAAGVRIVQSCDAASLRGAFSQLHEEVR